MPSAGERDALRYLRDFFCQSWDALVLHKDKVEVLLGQLDDAMTTNLAPTSLRRRMEESERAWLDLEKQYTNFMLLLGMGGSRIRVPPSRTGTLMSLFSTGT